MRQEFDAYYKWLGIPPTEQPPNHYRLLGLADFESDLDVIEGAADRQMAHVRTFQAGAHSALSQRILNEISAAKVCLLDRPRKAEYDGSLQAAKAGAAKPKLANRPPTLARPAPAGPSNSISFDAVPPPPLVKTAPRAVRRRGPRETAVIATAGCLAVAVALALYAALASRGSASSATQRHLRKRRAAMSKSAAPSQTNRARPDPIERRRAEASEAAKTGRRDTDDVANKAPAAPPVAPRTTEPPVKRDLAASEAPTEASPSANATGGARAAAGNIAVAEHAPPSVTKAPAPSANGEVTAAARPSLAELALDRRPPANRQELDDKAAAVKAHAASARSADELESLAMEYWSLVRMAAELDDFELGNRFATSMIQAARKTRDQGLLTDLQARAKQMQELRTAFHLAKPALAALQADPADSKANGAWGRYLAWFKSNWREGLPLLAKGGDEVAEIAARELGIAGSPEPRIALADEWWQIAEHEKKSIARRSLQEHACRWYERALSGLRSTDQQAVLRKIERSFGDATVYELPDDGSGVQLGGAEVNIGEVATVEFWVATTGRDVPLLTKRETADDQSLTFYLKGGRADVIGDGPFYRVDVWDAGSDEINDGRWHHIAAVKRGKALSLLVDGKLAGTGDSLLSFRSQSPWILGVHRPWSNSLSGGRFCRLRISNIARYHSGFTPDRTYERDRYTVWMR